MNCGIIEGAYLADILDQPRALSETFLALDASPELDLAAARLARGEYARIVLTGMGSSLHALHPFHQDLVARGYASVMAETSDLLYHLRGLVQPKTLVVVVSQSGQSIEVVRLLNQLPAGTDVIGVTNTAGSTLAGHATMVVLTRAGRESTVSCKSYLAALMALGWLSGILCGDDQGKVRVELSGAADLVSEYSKDWRGCVSALRGELQGVRSLFLTGRGASMAAVGVGGLILKESTHIHAEGMSSAAFRHGPFEMLSSRKSDVFVAVFLGDPRTSALNERLHADILKAGARAALIGAAQPGSPFDLQQAPERLRPILEMLPLEMMSLALAANQGREAGRFELASKVTAVE